MCEINNNQILKEIMRQVKQITDISQIITFGQDGVERGNHREISISYGASGAFIVKFDMEKVEYDKNFNELRELLKYNK